MTDPATTPHPAPPGAGVPRSPVENRPPVPGPPAAPGEAAERSLRAALDKLDGLGATSVHEHVEVYAGVDRALRERLAAAEG